MEPPGFDATGPNVARVYDYLLGGRDNYAADRAEAARLLGICPQLADVARENRAFLVRAVRYAAGQGVRQFADIGTGLPAWPSLTAAARDVVPAVKVVYVDHDPMVVAHVRAGLHESAAVAGADLADPAAVTGHPAFRGLIDLTQPVCLVFGLVLGLFPAGQAREIIAGYAGLVAPGSCIVISCGQVGDAGLWERLSGAVTAAAVHNHAPAELAGFLEGLELVPPGLAPARNWRGGWHDVPAAPPDPVHVLGGVARKPAPRRARGLVAR